MRHQMFSLRPAPVAQRLIFIFAVTILTPGLVLGFFGIRALLQERRLADRQIRERLDAAAENAGRRLELEIRDWQRAVEQVARSGATNDAFWPERVRKAVESGAAVVLSGSREKVQALPSGQLLYELSPIEQHPFATTEAEILELREKRYDQAIAAYRRALASTKSAERTRLLHGLARTLKKAGRLEEARQSFRTLEKETPIRIGSLPSDLLAIYEIADSSSSEALRLYRGLVEGRWPLEKASYIFYSQQTGEWIGQSQEARSLRDAEKRKLALTLAAEHFIQKPRSFSPEPDAMFIAFAHPERFVVLLGGEAFIRERVLPASDNPDFDFSLLSPQGGPAATYTLQSPEWPLRLYAWPKDSAALYAGMHRQQNIYLGMFAVVAALLVFGGYLIVQTLRSELAIAQMKSDFVSTVSHEFRSPLAGINQLGEMLRDGRVPDQERRHEYYAMIVGETQRLRRLVENLLDFSRMEDGRKEYRFEKLDPASWLSELAENFRKEIATRGLIFELVIPEKLPAILADRESLTTAVHNLLDNAVKYSRDAATVRLEATTEHHRLSISVRDRGIGIPEEDRPYIFEKFYRGRGESGRQVKGVGLGLNLVRHIVSAHGGTIEFDSKKGEGTTFTIHLKAAES